MFEASVYYEMQATDLGNNFLDIIEEATGEIKENPRTWPKIDQEIRRRIVRRFPHLAKCMVYIDLNMVRAGVVKHPSEYNPSGYSEIQNPSKRYRIIDPKALRDYFSIDDERAFQQAHRAWVEEELKNDKLQKSRIWSEAIAIGNEDFIENIHRQLKEKNTVGKKR